MSLVNNYNMPRLCHSIKERNNNYRNRSTCDIKLIFLIGSELIPSVTHLESNDFQVFSP